MTTTLETPEFYEGELLMETLYDMTKSMNEKVIEIETNMKEFKEYLELWIHEIKLPIASLELILHNEKQKDKKIYDQIRRIERNVEEMLYYSRMESSEKDYLIKKIDLANLIGKTILSFKDDFLYQKIELQVENIEGQVYTDAKWLEFILGQIIANAIKYLKEGEKTDDKEDKPWEEPQADMPCNFGNRGRWGGHFQRRLTTRI